MCMKEEKYPWLTERGLTMNNGNATKDQDSFSRSFNDRGSHGLHRQQHIGPPLVVYTSTNSSLHLPPMGTFGCMYLHSCRLPLWSQSWELLLFWRKFTNSVSVQHVIKRVNVRIARSRVELQVVPAAEVASVVRAVSWIRLLGQMYGVWGPQIRTMKYDIASLILTWKRGQGGYNWRHVEPRRPHVNLIKSLRRLKCSTEVVWDQMEGLIGSMPLPNSQIGNMPLQKPNLEICRSKFIIPLHMSLSSILNHIRQLDREENNTTSLLETSQFSVNVSGQNMKCHFMGPDVPRIGSYLNSILLLIYLITCNFFRFFWEVKFSAKIWKFCLNLKSQFRGLYAPRIGTSLNSRLILLFFHYL